MSSLAHLFSVKSYISHMGNESCSYSTFWIFSIIHLIVHYLFSSRISLLFTFLLLKIDFVALFYIILLLFFRFLLVCFLFTIFLFSLYMYIFYNLTSVTFPTSLPSPFPTTAIYSSSFSLKKGTGLSWVSIKHGIPSNSKTRQLHSHFVTPVWRKGSKSLFALQWDRTGMDLNGRGKSIFSKIK